MSGFGVNAYQKVAVDSGVGSADPHAMIMMLFDALVESVSAAGAHLLAGQVAEKGRALGRALRIVDEGLKASLDRDAGGPIADQLATLYEYMTMRLLQAHLRNDRSALDEVSRLAGEVRAAWAQIAPRTGSASGGAPAPGTLAQQQSMFTVVGSPAPASPPVTASVPGAPAARFFDGSSSGPVRRVTIAA
jgi:flagellar protein FliS